MEPFYAGLRDGDAAREDPRKGPREPRRGCGGAALLVMLALVAAWLGR